MGGDEGGGESMASAMLVPSALRTSRERSLMSPGVGVAMVTA